MAHNIAVIDGQYSIGYMGETPWHRLGQGLTPEAQRDVFRAMAECRVDYHVEKAPIYVKTLDGTFRAVDGWCATTREDSVAGTVALGVNGAGYALHQSRDIFGAADTLVREFGARVITAGALGVGEKIWMLLSMPYRLNLAGTGDVIDSYLLIIGSYDGSSKTTLRPTTVRVVCANTLKMATRGSESVYSVRHCAGNAEKLDAMGTFITSLGAALQATGETYETLMARKLTESETADYIAQSLGIPDLANMAKRTAERYADCLALVSNGTGAAFAPGSAWTAYNAVTEFIDHKLVTAKGRSATADSSALFGAGATVKARAMDLALDLIAA